MRDEGVVYVAGHPLLNRRCTRLPGCICLQNDLYCVEWGVKLYSLTQPSEAQRNKGNELPQDGLCCLCGILFLLMLTSSGCLYVCILKVSESCGFVFLDGTETRGSSSASVIVKYGRHARFIQFRVWIPELPLDVEVSDARLGRFIGWQVPVTVSNSTVELTTRLQSCLIVNVTVCICVAHRRQNPLTATSAQLL